MVKFKFVEENEASELQATTEAEISEKAIFEPKESFISENTEKQEIEPKTPEKSVYNLKDLEFILGNSGIKVVLELNDKTLTRTKSGILGEYGIKNYCNMNKKQLDNELSKLIASNILKTLKGSVK